MRQRMQGKVALRSLGLGVLIWGLSVKPATANSWPPMAIWLLQVPLGAGLVSYGVGLGAIALLEGFILARREHLPLRRSLLVASLANLYSLLLGLFLVMGFAALPYSSWGLVFLGILYGSLIRSSWFCIPYGQWQILSQFPRWRACLRLLTWSGFWLIVLMSGFFLIFGVSALNPRTTFGVSFPDLSVPFYINVLQLLSVMLFTAIGFAISVVSEASCLRRLLPEASHKLWQTALVMNLRSYAYIAVPLTLAFLVSRFSR